MSSKTAEIYESIMNAFKEELKKGNNPFYSGVQISHHTKKPYQGFNSFHLALVAKQKGYTCHEWLTFKQVKQHDGAVNKGEKSTPVFFFMPSAILEYGNGEKKWVSKDTANKEVEKLEKEGYSVKRTDTFILKYYNVFNVEQTTLRDKFEYKRSKEAPMSIRMATDTHITIINKEEPFFQYDDTIDVIVGPFFSYSTFPYPSFYKSVIEATKHETRCDRLLDYKEEELVKNIGASMLAYATSIDFHLDSEIIEALLEAIDKHPYSLWKYSRLADEGYRWISEKAALLKAAA